MLMMAYLVGALTVAGVSTRPDVTPGRVLHFPVDRSLGMLYIWDASITEPDPTKPMDFGQYLGEATGEVSVAPGKRVRLTPSTKGRLRRALPNLFLLEVDVDRSLAAPPESPEADSAPTHPKPGTAAPDFTVTTLDGAEFKLSAQRGKVVVLHFWATWCRPCIAGLPELKKVQERLQKKYGDRLVWVNLAMDDIEAKVGKVIETHRWPGLHARIGMQSKLAADYGVAGAPDEFLIGPDGRILLNQESPEGAEETESVIDKALKASGAWAP